MRNQAMVVAGRARSSSPKKRARRTVMRPQDGSIAATEERELPVGTRPPAETLPAICMGLRASQALFVAAKLGIGDLLAHCAMTTDELASATDTHAPSLRRLMRALVALGLFRESENDRFSLAPAGELLRSNVAGSQRAVVLFLAGPVRWRCWSDLLSSIRSGEPAADRVLGMPLFDYYASHTEESLIHDEAMGALSIQFAAALLDVYDLSRYRCAVDVGGGSGELLAQILRAYPLLAGVLYDLPHVVARATPVLTAAGVANRCRIEAGSFFETAPAGGDLYLLKNITHDWDDTRAVTILSKCREAMSVQATVLVFDRLLPERAECGRNVDTYLIDLEMLTLAPNGRERTRREMEMLFSRAGFVLTNVLTTASSLCIIEGRPA
jgi:hypothetical protein